MGFPLIGRGKSSIGYNGKVFFGGIFANADASQSRIKTLKTEQLQYNYGLYLGFRFIQYTKTKAQLKKEAQAKKLAEKEAAKKAKEAKRKPKAK